MKNMVMFLLILFATRLQAQETICLQIHPSMDRAATISAKKYSGSLQLIFNQQGLSVSNRQYIDSVIRTAYFISKDSMLQLLKKMEVINADTLNIHYNKGRLIFQKFDSLYSNRISLSKLEDKRIILDGMRCIITIKKDSQTYQLYYRPPYLKENRTMHSL